MLQRLGLLVALAAVCFVCEAKSPNIIIIYVDDMGYGDLAVYGNPTQEWGRIDDMGRDGMMFTNYYTAAPLCTPSRAAMLTGRQPARYGFSDATADSTFSPMSVYGLPWSEYTLAEALRDLGYATGLVGKWHLGINSYNSSDGVWLPKNQGFDFVGHLLPLSNDPDCDENESPEPMVCFLYYGDEIVQQPFQHENLTQNFVADAIEFIDAHTDEPFFLYFATAHLHPSLYANGAFNGSSVRGAYGDNVNELHWAVGEVLDYLDEVGIANDTLVLLTSDNGPGLSGCEEGGDAGPLSGGKGTYAEGGIRMPMIAYWPETIEGGTRSAALSTALDIFPTMVELAGGTLDDDITYDGLSIADVLLDNADTPHDYVLFYCNEYLYAVRTGSYKFVFGELTTVDRMWQTCNCPLGINGDSTLIKGCASHQLTMSAVCGVGLYDKPILYNVDKDPREIYPLPLASYSTLLRNVYKEITSFETNFDMASGILSKKSCDVVPCCDDTKDQCECNYPGDDFTAGYCF